MGEIIAHVGQDTLHFPDGTSSDVIQNSVKQYVAQKNPTAAPTVAAPVSTSAPTSAPVTSNPTPKDSQKGIVESVLNILKHGITNQPMSVVQDVKDYLHSGSTNDKLADLGNVAREGADAAVGGLAGIGSGPVGVSFGMAGTDAVLRKVTGTKPADTLLSKAFPNDPKGDNTIKNTLEGTIENEALGKVVGGVGSAASKIISGAKEALSPGSVVGPELADNTKTFSMLADKGKRGVSKVIEDIFAPSGKSAAIQETNQVLENKLGNVASKMSGQLVDLSGATQNTTANMADAVQNEVRKNFSSSVDASNKTAGGIGIIAEMNNPAKMTGAAGGLTVPGSNIPSAPNVDGPVYLKSTIEEANKYLEKATKGLTGADPDNPLIKAANKIITETGATFNPDGTVKTANPISFKQAWQWKKDAGDLAFGSPLSDLSTTDSKFKNVFSTIDSDVENSMKQWPVKGDEALSKWNETKQIVANRYSQFSPQGETGAKVRDLLNAKDVQIPALDAVIQNPQKLQRLLNTGDLSTLLAPGENKGQYSSIANTNTRKLLKGYTISRIWQNGTTLNADGLAVPNVAKMQEMWKAAENTTQMKMIYSAENRADIGQFFKELANVNQKMSGGGSRYLKFLGIKAGVVSLGGGLAESLITNGSLLPLHTGEVVGGAIGGILLSGNALGYLLTNKNTARIMQGMAQDQLSVPAKIAARAIAFALKNQTVKIQKSDGSTIDAKFNNN